MIKTLSVTILILGIISLRFFHLTTNPSSLFSDEVDAGYQAYVFNNFGTDYYGNRFPTHFHSFADWRTPFIIYSIALSQKIFGINDLSVRFPPAIFGLLACWVFYLLLKQLQFSSKLSLFGFALFSLNPIFLHYSRAAWEVSGMTLVFLLGLLFWFKFTQKSKPLHLYLSLLFFCLTPYFYATSKLYFIFTLFSLCLIWHQQLRILPVKTRLGSFFFTILLLLPLATDTIRGRAGFRFSYINIFNDPTTPSTVDYFRQKDAVNRFGNQIGLKTSFDSALIHNKLTTIASKFAKNYIASFGTDYLFLTGDTHKRQGFGTHGNFYYLDLLFIVFGLTFAIYQNRHSQINRFFLLLLLFAPIPFSLTRDSNGPQSTRLILLVPILLYFIVLGLNTLKSKLILAFVLIIYLISFFNFYHLYFSHYRDYSAVSWHTGMKEAVNIALDQKYSHYYFSNSYEPFIPFFLYYSNYHYPNAAQRLQYQDTPFFQGQQLDEKYFFGHLSFNQSPLPENSIFVVPAIDYLEIQNQPNLKIKPLQKINKTYDSQSEFYIFTLQ